MTDRAEIERLLNMTGRTLEGLPTEAEYMDAQSYGVRCEEIDKALATGGFDATYPCMMHQSDVIELLVSALRDALAKVPKWISVEERLPEEGERVLCTDGHCVFEQYRVPLSCVYGTWDRGGLKSPMQNVTHWMPLPEPPEGDA